MSQQAGSFMGSGIKARDDLTSQSDSLKGDKVYDESLSQQGDSIMGPSQQGSYSSSKSDDIQTPREKRKAFERRMLFNSALSQGKTPEEAARFSGVKLGMGETLKSTEVMDLKYHGKVPKKRKRL